MCSNAIQRWWHTLIASVIASVFLSIVVLLNSRGATRYHIGFPVIARSSGGPRGAKFFIFIRGAVATIFFSTNLYYGGMLMAIVLRCIFGTAWDNIPNHLPADGGITSALCPILINQPDIARYAQRPYQATWSQTLGIFISKILIMFLSAGTTSATQGFLGTSYWNVWDLYDAILTKYWGPGARAGIFFACFVSLHLLTLDNISTTNQKPNVQGMVLAILATNAGTNSLPAGADMSGLLPRYISIVRGQIICGLLGPLFFPWKIIANASSFLTFLSSYTVFLMPICGIMVVDYWIIRRGNLHIPSLYSREPGTPYTYWKGWNLRAIAAWVAGTAFVIHGVAGELQPDLTGQASKNMYKIGFLLSFIMGSAVYFAGCLLFPVPLYPLDKEDTPATWEYMADSEGFFAGETRDTIRLGTGVVVGVKLDGDAHTKEVV